MALKTNVDVGAGQSEDHRAQRSEAASLLWSDSHLRADANLKAPSLGSSREKHGRRSEKKGTHRLFQKHQYSCLLQQSHQVGAGKPQRGWWHIPSSLQACVVFPTLGLGTHSRETAETPPPCSTARNTWESQNNYPSGCVQLCCTAFKFTLHQYVPGLCLFFFFQKQEG